jgi:hypothetical protein
LESKSEYRITTFPHYEFMGVLSKPTLNFEDEEFQKMRKTVHLRGIDTKANIKQVGRLAKKHSIGSTQNNL